MRKLRLLVWIVPLAALVFLFAPRPTSITRAKFDRLHPGMTRGEVEAVLGPSGDFRNAPNEYDMAPEHQPAIVFGRGNPGANNPTTLWRSDEADVGLNFDKSEKV